MDLEFSELLELLFGVIVKREVEEVGYNYELLSSKPLTNGIETATILN